jgi:LysM repeat protein
MNTEALLKLKILAFKSNKYKLPNFVGFYLAMFNPESYTSKYEIDYKAPKTPGGIPLAQRFGRMKPNTYTFNLVFDGTGVSAGKTTVPLEIENFLSTCYNINGDIHRPNHLILNWGTLISKCVLISADVTYDLFTPEGIPLRAKVNATFSENINDAESVKAAHMGSPDLTKRITVKSGDSLPLLSYKHYENPSYYIQLAKVNRLDNFRKIKDGTKLKFPSVQPE